jgi:hypothetical protein
MPADKRKDVVGIDFGTTNTYITVCPYGTKNKMPLHLDGRTPAIDTAILYADEAGREPGVFPLVGEAATLTFGQADPQEALALGYRYRAGFKLGIVGSEEAGALFLDFFRAISRDALRNGTPLDWGGDLVVFGAPSEAPPEFRAALRRLAKEAGLGRIEILDEPQGALLTDLGYGRFPLDEVLDGYLVVDFGGGTCDFAFLREGEVEASWGDMGLGGRLFDDLFFQWVLDQNPGALDLLESQNRDFYALSYLSRRLKEDFSEAVQRDPKARVRSELGRFGAVRGLGRGEFLERASAYAPSGTFLACQAKFGLDSPGRLAGGPVDLISWFSEALLSGLGDPGRVRAVSLAGGSSRWFFVRELLVRAVGPGARVLNSPNPFGAISEGLSILPAVRRDYEEAKARVAADRGPFLRDGVMRHVRDSLWAALGGLVSRVLAEFFDLRVAPALRAHAGSPLSISGMEEEVQALARAYEPRLRELAAETLAAQLAAIQPVAEKRIREWLRSHNLSAAWELAGGRGDPGHLAIDLSLGDRLAEPLFLALGGLASSILALLSASLCGGAGLALLAAGPAGLALGALGGAAAAGAVLLAGKGKILGYLKGKTVPAFLSGTLLSDSALASLRSRLGEGLRNELEAPFGVCVRALEREIDSMISQVLEKIGIVNVFLGRRLPGS